MSYLRYLDHQKVKWIIISLLAFLLSLGVKGQGVVLAVTLIAVDILLERKLLTKRVILEKLPFFIVAIIFGLLAMQGHESAGTLDEKALGYSYMERIAFASYSIVQYFLKLFVPYNLSAFYPYPESVDGNIPYFY